MDDSDTDQSKEGSRSHDGVDDRTRHRMNRMLRRN
jgi:hypothetical protein